MIGFPVIFSVLPLLLATASMPLHFVPAEREAWSFAVDRTKDPQGARAFDVDLPRSDCSTMLDAAAFGVSETNTDNTAALRMAFAAAKRSGAAGVRLKRGRYAIRSDAPFEFDGLKDFTFDGGGSTLIACRRRGAFMRFTNCERLRLCGFVLDWDWERDPLASIVCVAAVAPDSYDLVFADHDDFPRKDTGLELLSAWNQETRSVGFEGGLTRMIDFARTEGVPTKRQWLSGNLVRVFRKPAGLAPGQLYRLQHYYYQMGGIVLKSNAHVRLEDVTVYSTPGHAFVLGGTQHHTLFEKVKIVVPEGDVRRVITCTADHLHVAQSRGFIRLEDCEFSRGADDIVNLHDCSGFARRQGARTVRTVNARNFGEVASGARVELRRGDYAPSGFTGTVVQTRAVDRARGVYDVTFAEDLPDDRGEGFVLFDWTYDTRNVIIRNCRFHDNRARGLLILARDVTVEDCVFRHHEMGAIKIETGYTLNKWSEGYGVSNVVVRRCLFDDVNPSGNCAVHGQRSVYCGVYLRKDPSTEVTEFPVLRDILFEDNRFVNDSGVVAWISSASGVTFRGNEIDESAPKRSPHACRGRIRLDHVRDVRIVNNTWQSTTNAPSPGVEWSPADSKIVTCAGNLVR